MALRVPDTSTTFTNLLGHDKIVDAVAEVGVASMARDVCTYSDAAKMAAQPPRKDYSSSQMSYDLGRIRLHGLIVRTTATNSYTLTPDGIRVAVFYTKLQTRASSPPRSR